MRSTALPFLLIAALLPAQTPAKSAKANPAKPAASKSATKATAKPAPEAEAARKGLRETLDAIDAAWFGQPYQGISSVDMQGTLGIALSGAAINQKVDSLSQGQVKGNSQGGSANLRVKGTYFANGDFKTDLAGDFGTILYTRRGNRGFIYSKEQNAYTTRVDPAASDAPLTYMTWFRQTLNDIKAVYVDGPTFQATLAGEENVDGRTVQRLVFTAPTQGWDAKKREQSLAQSLGFWKRGRLEVSVDKTSKQPIRLDFRNDEQGVHTRMDFSYAANNRLQSVNINNSSRGFEGPGWLRVGYGSEGRMSNVAGELASQDKKVSFAMDLNWSKTRTAADITAIPPAGATKRGREEMETQLLVGLAAKIFDLQRAGLNLRSVAIGAK
ncbi:hypothetical protein [Geothrix sp. PMB-07]|uniref:hypothetical protein n=1 Tax=Geothrix sp. PMB-07 TaxID=3068640 RepID=UPI0027420D5D|nr:hypothetical protein [Geothrix sp. PMB-07]WLT31638.1 hypothetical protein Q9293_18200 [Geothrix sp. PMB-07]